METDVTSITGQQAIIIMVHHTRLVARTRIGVRQRSEWDEAWERVAGLVAEERVIGGRTGHDARGAVQKTITGITAIRARVHAKFELSTRADVRVFGNGAHTRAHA